MPLKAFYATQAEIPESQREFYVEKDGKFVLDAEGVEDVTGLKRSLERERAEKRALEATAAKFKNIDPEKARAALEKLEALEDKELIAAGDVDKLVQVRTDRMRQDLEGRLAAVSGENQTLSAKLSEVLIDNGIQQGAIKHKVRDTAVTDVLLRGRNVFKLVDGKAIPHKPDGSVWYGKDGNTPLTQDEWIGSVLTQEAPHMFESSTGGGTPPGGGVRPSVAGGARVISAEAAKDFRQYNAAKAEAARAGVELVIQ